MRLKTKNLSSTKVILSGLVIVILLARITYVLNENVVAVQHTKTDTESSLIARSITNEDHTIGDLSAPIQMIVYSEFDCQYCKSFYETTMPKLKARFGNNIVVAYRHFPLASHPNTQIKEEASECVYLKGGNDAFWKFTKKMFSAPQDRIMDAESLAVISLESGVSKELFISCMNNGEGKSRVLKDKLEGSIAGVYQTPSILLKSKHRALIVGGNYYSQLSAGIVYLLDTNMQIDKLK